MNTWRLHFNRICRIFTPGLLAVIFFVMSNWLAGVPQVRADVTGVYIVNFFNPKKPHSGDAVCLYAIVLGTGDYDNRVIWSMTPSNAGTIYPTGLFIASLTFAGEVKITATSVEKSAISSYWTIRVESGNDVKHVDQNNVGRGDGSARHPYCTIQAAIDHSETGDTIKVAQGTYWENVNLSHPLVLLGGFAGGSPADYASNVPGDFVTRSTDHVTQVTTIQSPDSKLSVVDTKILDSDDNIIYAVDGFTLTGGSNGIKAVYNTSDTFYRASVFISQNLITGNGILAEGNKGGGIYAHGVDTFVINNLIINNQSGDGGGLYISSGSKAFFIQDNLIEDNRASNGPGGYLADIAGKWRRRVFDSSVAFNVLRGNRANVLLDYGGGGGFWLGGGPVNFYRNVYNDNEAKNIGGGLLLDGSVIVNLRHELVCNNRTTLDDAKGGGIYVNPGATVTLDNCTITGNDSPSPYGNGLIVRETAKVQVSNSIIWGNSGDQIYSYPDAAFTMTYSDSQPCPGAGNISKDPLFANPTAGDYHLKSARGRWNPATFGWVYDAVHSPCIDAGDPSAAFALEPQPNGSRTNLGVYGNTQEASLSKLLNRPKRDLLSGIRYLLIMGK